MIAPYLLYISLLLLNCSLADSPAISIERITLSSTECSRLENDGFFLSNEFITWDKLSESGSPFKTVMDMISFILRRRIFFQCLVNCTPSIITNFPPSPFAIKWNIFILTGNREVNSYLNLLFMKRATRNRSDIRVILIQLDENPTLQRLTQEFNFSYIFLPKQISYLSGCAGLFPKSLGLNLAFLLTPESQWNLFHDIDIIIPGNFFTLVDKASEEHTHWFVTYDLLYSMNPFEISSDNMKTTKKIRGINVGGSLAVSTDIFKSIGGYDPEIFCGWSAEDIFIVDKLKLFAPIFRVKMTLAHVQHKISEKFGFYNRISSQLRTAFVDLWDDDKKKFLEIKKNYYCKMEPVMSSF